MRMDARWKLAVQILDHIFGPQLDRFQRSLGLTTQRHQALSNNLANVNTPGYKRRDVDFNVHLDEATGRVADSGSATRGFESKNVASLRLDGNSVDLEQEVMSLAETELRYQAVSDMTASMFAGLKNVIKEGRQ